VSAFRQSDVWFGTVVAIFFGVAAVVFFGRAVTYTSFWTSLLTIFGFVIVANLIRRIIEKLNRAAKFAVWFALGFGAAFIFTIQRAESFEWVSGMIFGVGLAFAEYLTERRGLEEPVNGRP